MKRLPLLVGILIFCRLELIAQGDVVLFFQTTSYQYGDSTAYLDTQAKFIKDDLMFTYAFHASSYTNYTRQNFFNSINNECREDSSKQLLVYISGRSAFNKDGEGFLVLSDSDSLDYESMIPIFQLGSLFDECSAQHVLVLLDVPGAGGSAFGTSDLKPQELISRDSLSREELVDSSMKKRTALYYANNMEKLYPVGRSNFTLMGSKFLEVLRGYGGADGIISLQELDDYLVTVTRAPRIGAFAAHEKGGEFLFIAR